MFTRLWKKLKRGPEDNKDEDHYYYDDLIKTHFLDFDDFDVPEGETTEGSDDESDSIVNEKREKYATKEEEDVAVFLSFAERMSMKSLLHLLQGHVRANNLGNECIQQYADIARAEALRKPTMKNPRSKPKKQFRWAEVTGDQVRVVVHEIESYKNLKDELWWSAKDMHAIRKDLIETVSFFRKYKHNYIGYIETIAKKNQSDIAIETAMKMATKDCFARGLESHIVRFLSDHRRSTVEAIISEQEECRESGDDYDVTSHCLRSQSLAYSKLSTDFAVKMAQCDQIISLKANMSRWDTGC